MAWLLIPMIAGAWLYSKIPNQPPQLLSDMMDLPENIKNYVNTKMHPPNSIEKYQTVKQYMQQKYNIQPSSTHP